MMDLLAFPRHIAKVGLHQDTRPPDQGPGSSSHPQIAWIVNHPEPADHRPNLELPPIPLNVTPYRFPRHQIDARRPVMSLPSQEVIDLTEENSPSDVANSNSGSIFGSASQRRTRPRLVRDVISIDDQETPGDQQNLSSPELEFMFSRTLLPTVMPQSRRRVGRQPEGGSSEDSSLEGDANSRSRDNGNPQAAGATWAEWRNRGHRNRYIAIEEGSGQHQRPQTPQPPPIRDQVRRAPLTINDIMTRPDPMFMNAEPNLDLPGHLDFYTQGFHMGPIGHIGNLVRQPAPPTYDPPSPPRPGYTRAPKEDDILICPNCEGELGVGNNEIKKQVWVIKRCGHVYCGECAKNRQKAGRTKSDLAALPKPFAKCVVDGCSNHHSISHHKSLFQVFL